MKKLLHFSAEWCNPCKQMAPMIDKFILENQDIEYIKINVDTDFEMVGKYGVQTIPTLISIVDQDIKGRISGITSEEKIKSLFG